MKKYLRPKQIVAALFVMLLILPFSACKKYEDGPALSLRTKMARLKNFWRLEQLLVNGADSTAAFLGSDHSLVMNLETSNYAYWYFVNSSYPNGTHEMELLSYSFVDGKDGFLLSSLSPVPERLCKFYTIKRLTNKELWLEAKDPGFEGYEFRFEGRKKP
jgi:hypothetical protein